ncbi:dihydrolipoyl dehydrogenase [Desulfosarcina ovata]|uniref:Dihydrolipoyl dehydrogenase n=1 Tax=Desulfosarcina ovata subsp. ovata TaxID=2752305 RepID=A0A5K8AJF6_9BACT|nr:dihydrolipoyl dehydrogenase [Desulfosarcina ovata]BBO92835.1 dihydrolipoyl dehydrogenase [Desulfosarcina ovata subsp. ovata]
MRRKVDVVIIGAGSAGVTALFTLARAGKSFVLINSGEEGSTCTRVGCMPSKALIEAASLHHARERFDEFGLRGAQGVIVDGPAVLARVRAVRDQLVKGVVGRYHQIMDDTQFISGHARIVAPDCVEVNGERIEAGAIIIATGSSPVIPPAFSELGDALLTTDTLFEQTSLPRSLAVVGLGAIGCEMGQALARLGVEVHGFGGRFIAGVKDPVAAEKVIELFGREMSITMGARVVPHLENGQVVIEAGDRRYTVERVLASLGRRPNIGDLGLENLGIELDEHGIPPFDRETLQIGDLPVYIIGDANGYRLILHESADEGQIAALNIIYGKRRPFPRRVRMSVTFTAPQIASVGAQLNELDAETTAIGSASAQMNGRALINGDTDGLIRIYADKQSGRLLGASLAIADGEHMAHWLAMAIGQAMTLDECLTQPFYHPVIEETLRDALQDCLTQTELGLPNPPGLMPGVTMLPAAR